MRKTLSRVRRRPARRTGAATRQEGLSRGQREEDERAELEGVGEREPEDAREHRHSDGVDDQGADHHQAGRGAESPIPALLGEIADDGAATMNPTR